MAADTASSSGVECPDPSVHTKQHKLSEQASSAALYVTHPERNADRGSPLNPDGKLSSKSAAASLKYAKPQDLPSFPTHGLDSTGKSAGQAAMLAKDYKMKDLWQPELSSAGSKAALLAHKDGVKLDLWQPSASAAGNSAAKLAMQNKTLSPQLDYGYTKDGRSNALLAATKSQRNGRQRSGSTPAPAVPVYPDSHNSAYNALNAATISHRASVKAARTGAEPDDWESPAMQAARIQNRSDHVDREMYTEKPPVEIEQQEKRDAAALRASVISMAKQMYDHENRTVLGDAPVVASADALNRSNTTTTSPDLKQEALRYIHLQDAAHKLAQERLAKVDKNFENERYREYYGYSTQQQRKSLQLRGFNRKRASSEAAKDELDSDDEEQARAVRRQMRDLNNAAAGVDQKKQQTDREALMAAAQQRVQQRMLDMDEKVFQQTGKVSQAMMDDWEAKARKRATEDAEKREANRGKTHIGAGKYMDTAEIEAIAQARLKPTLDEINDNAEKKRARDEELRLDRAEAERNKREEKARQKEIKEEQKRSKEEDKIAAKQEKEQRKAAEKDEPEAKQGFFARLSSKRKSRDVSKPEAEAVTATTAYEAAEAEEEEVAEPKTISAPVLPPVDTTADNELEEPIVEEHTVHTAPVTEAPVVTADTTAPPPVEPTVHDEPAVTAPVPVAPSNFEKISDAKDEPAEERSAKASDVAFGHGHEDKSQKGVKGFFNKLAHRKSKIEPKESKEVLPSKESKPAATVTSTAPVTSAAPVETAAVAGPAAVADEQHKEADVEPKPVVADKVTEPPTLPDASKLEEPTPVTAAAGAASPSSFRRHDAGDDADVSSLESSGVEEADFKEGRTGRIARALGLKKGDKADKSAKSAEPGTLSKLTGAAEPAHTEPETAAVKAVDSKDIKDGDEDAEETFEEARDTVDPDTVTEPAFTGQKATSNARETKFQEVL